MKLTALITALVLGGTATIASAQPYRDTQWRDRPSYHAPRHFQLLATGRLSRGMMSTAVPTRARVDALKLEASGPVFVDKVIVTFANGRTRVLEVDKWIRGGDPAFVDLPGRDRQISRIAVQGRGSWRSQLSVLAG